MSPSAMLLAAPTSRSRPPTCGQRVVAQVGGTWDITNQFQFGIKWDGRFNEDYNSNSVIGRLEYKF
jgi:hypothetical protein